MTGTIVGSSSPNKAREVFFGKSPGIEQAAGVISLHLLHAPSQFIGVDDAGPEETLLGEELSELRRTMGAG